MTAACHNCVPPCFYDANLGVEHLLNCSARSLKINAILFTGTEFLYIRRIIMDNKKGYVEYIQYLIKEFSMFSIYNK